MKYTKSNFPKGEKHQVIIAMVVNGGANWGISERLSAEQIDRIENLFIEIANELERAKENLKDGTN